MTSTRIEIRNAIFCAAVAMTALLLAWPFAEMSFNDDWTWAFTVKQLLGTGHLTYNGWSSPSVIAQAYWALLWVKCFGFSLTILRVSTLPMAAGAIVICYALGRQAKLSAAFSTFAALTLGLSPIFMPLAASFMTDVPGLFFLLLSTFALVRGFEKESRSRAIAWIIGGAVAALLGGSGRQIVWVVPLIILPYFAGLRRKDRAFAIVALLSWIFVFVGAAVMQHWFNQQPYATPDPPLMAYPRGAVRHPKLFGVNVAMVLITLFLFVLPTAIAGVGKLKRPHEFVAAAIFVVIGGLLFVSHHESFPWMGNVLTPTGILSGVELYGERPAVLTEPIRFLLSVVVVGALSMLIASVKSLRQWPTFFLRPSSDDVPVCVLVLTALGLLGLEMTRCVFDVAYDRHLLAFIPFVAIALLVWFQNNGLQKIPPRAWFTLLLFAIFAVGTTQEVTSLARARIAAIQKLKASGISDNQIEAGFEHDYWTEVNTSGHINDKRLQNPPSAYQKDKGPLPNRRPLYRLEWATMPVTATTEFGSVPYFSYLPPFHRRILIDRFLDPWWLDPKRAATQPVPKQMIPEVLLWQYYSHDK